MWEIEKMRVLFFMRKDEKAHIDANSELKEINLKIFISNSVEPNPIEYFWTTVYPMGVLHFGPSVSPAPCHIGI